MGKAEGEEHWKKVLLSCVGNGKMRGLAEICSKRTPGRRKGGG